MLGRLAQLDGDGHLLGELIVSNGESRSISHAGRFEHRACLLVRIGSIVRYGILTSLEPHHGIYGIVGCLSIVARSVDSVVMKIFLERHKHLVDVYALPCVDIHHREAHRLDIAERIGPCPTGTSGGECLGLDETERSLATRRDINGEVMVYQSVGDDCKLRRSLIGHNLLIQVVIERIAHHTIVSRQQLQLIAAQAILGILCIVGVEHQCLLYRRASMLHIHLHLMRVRQEIQRSTRGTLGRCSVVLVEFELHIAILYVLQVILLGTACEACYHTEEQRERGDAKDILHLILYIHH